MVIAIQFASVLAADLVGVMVVADSKQIESALDPSSMDRIAEDIASFEASDTG